MTTVNLDDVCNYIINAANHHTQRTARTHHAARGASQEQITFVLRRIVEELQAQFGDGPSVPAGVNQTYRNRATT